MPVDDRFSVMEAGTAPTAPRPLKLTIEDLELLDLAWPPETRRSTELIDGRIYHTPFQYGPRARARSALMMALRRALEQMGSPLFVGTRGSIAMPPFDLPLPDVLITDDPRGPGFIPISSVHLVAEIAQGRLGFFMGAKAEMYAKHGVPEYWVIDIEGRVVHQQWKPAPQGYAQRREVMLGARVDAVTMVGVTVETGDL